MSGAGTGGDVVGLTPALVREALGRPVRTALWLHRTDRWYFGDFVRHSPWLGWLHDGFAGARVDLASHPAYLGLFADDRFGAHHDARLAPTGHDLVVTPGPNPPPDDARGGPDGTAPHAHLLTWDTGWRLDVAGRTVAHGAKHETNYFRAAHPRACADDVACPGTPWRPTAPVFTDHERGAAAALLEALLPGPGPVVVYNPTASTPYTRGTDVPKEVEGRLAAPLHAQVVAHVARLLPDHRVLVASALKPHDLVNAAAVAEVAALAARTCGADRVVAPPTPPAGAPWAVATARVTPAQAAAAATLRGFAALLADPRVCTVVGAGTGTNTHLAALVGRGAMSFERGADPQMRRNWTRPGEFKMGSFRWRNPAPVTAVHVLDWPAVHHPPTAAEALHRAAEAFVTHHHLVRATTPGPGDGTARDGLTAAPRRACADDLRAAPALLAGLAPALRGHLGDFADETAYLQLVHPGAAGAADAAGAVDVGGAGGAADVVGAADGRTGGLPDLVAALHGGGPAARVAVALYEDSNLHKAQHLLHRGAPGAGAGGPGVARGAGASGAAVPVGGWGS